MEPNMDHCIWNHVNSCQSFYMEPNVELELEPELELEL